VLDTEDDSAKMSVERKQVLTKREIEQELEDLVPEESFITDDDVGERG